MFARRRSVWCLLSLWVGLTGSELTNWAGNVRFNESLFFEPATVDELVAIVRESPRVALVGSRHSFNNISQTTSGALISTRKLNKILQCCDDEVVTVQPGVTYAALGNYLHERGFAIENYASLPHLTVAGAVATGTHGSGAALGNLATSVRALKIAVADGNIVHVDQKHSQEMLEQAVIGLGALGVVVELSLAVVPAFDVQQCIYTDVELKQLRDTLDSILNSTYSVSLFTLWQPGGRINSLWLKHKLAPNSSGSSGSSTSSSSPSPSSSSSSSADCPVVAGRQPSSTAVHPVPGADPAACSKPGVGPSFEQLPHFLPEHTPSFGEELQTELFVAREHFWEAAAAIEAWNVRSQLPLARALLVSELRFVRADRLALSPQRVLGDSVGIHFTWQPKPSLVAEVLEQLLHILRPFRPLPHWGKLFDPRAFALRERYGAALAEMEALLSEFDPQRKFTTDFVRECLFAHNSTLSQNQEARMFPRRAEEDAAQGGGGHGRAGAESEL